MLFRDRIRGTSLAVRGFSLLLVQGAQVQVLTRGQRACLPHSVANVSKYMQITVLIR